MTATNPYLPPIYEITATDHAEAYMYLGLLARESRDIMAPWLNFADENVTLYTYGDRNYTQSGKVICNDIQNAIIAQTDIQTKEPPTATLDPIETGEPSVYYFNGDETTAMMLGIPPESLLPTQMLDGTVLPPQPLNPAQGEQLCQMQETGMLKPDTVVELNDKLVTDTFQTVFNVFWSRANIDRTLRTHLMRTNIEGFGFLLYEWDAAEQKIVLRPMSLKQVYIDHTIDDIQDAAYAGVDLIIDAEEAMKLYPQFADEIEKQAEDAQPYSYEGNDPGDVFKKSFRRKMVNLRIFWLRNQPVAMTHDEALEGGHVEQAELPTGEITESMDEMGQVVAMPATRQAFMRDGEEVSPLIAGEDGNTAPHPNWPMRRATRQITLVKAIVVDDRECEHWDIPLLHNVNIPVPGRPYGIGEPFRLKSLQEARNSMMTALVDHTEFYRAPMSAMSRSMHNSLGEEAKDLGVVPGMRIIVEDNVWQLSGGKIEAIIEPPAMPVAVMEGQNLIKQELTDQSGHTEVMRGQSDGQMSGKAIQSLQTASSSLIGFKAQRTGDVVQRLARLMLFNLVNHLPLKTLKKIISKYPDHILQEIQTRAHSFEWDVKVTVTAGSGMALAQKKQEALQQLQVGAISMETYCDIANIDYHKEKMRMQAGAMGMQPMAQPQPSAPNGQQQPPSASAAA